MTSVALTRRIKASSTRACPRPTFLPFPPSLGALPAGQPVRVASRSAERAAPSATPSRMWVEATAAALLVIAGAVALDFAILWTVSGRVIERLPF